MNIKPLFATKQNEQQTNWHLITDLYNNVDEIPSEADKHKTHTQGSDGSSVQIRFQYFQRLISWKLWGIIITTAIICGLLGSVVNFLQQTLTRFKNSISGYSLIQAPTLQQFVIFTSISIVYVWIATFMCEKFGSEAEGSGIPELKTVLSGVNYFKYYEKRLLIPKAFGVAFAGSSGMIFGKEGPFVHCAAIIANALTKFWKFKSDNYTNLNTKIAITSAAANGLTMTFGVLFTGVIFCVEVSSTLYNTPQLWRSFVSVTICYFSIHSFDSLLKVFQYQETQFSSVGLGIDIINFAILGIICGVLGSLWVYLFSKLNILRRSGKIPFLQWRYSYSACTVILTCSLISVYRYLQLPTAKLQAELLNYEDLSKAPSQTWGKSKGEIEQSLLIAFTLQFLLTILSANTPVPVGICVPVIGACFGRIFAVQLSKYILIPVKCSYAVAGAAALTASISRTISTSLLVLELTDQWYYSYQTFIATIFAYSISNLLNYSVFDTIIFLRKLPYLPILKNQEIYNQTAKDICTQPDWKLEIGSSIESGLNIVSIFENQFNKDTIVPVVNSYQDNHIAGYIVLEDLINYFKKEIQTNPSRFRKDSPAPKLISIFTNILNKEEHEASIEGGSRIVRISMEEAQWSDDILTKSRDINYTRVSIKNFLNGQIDFSDITLKFNNSPIILNSTTPISKIQYIFCTLGNSIVFVTENGQYKGIITKDQFLRLK